MTRTFFLILSGSSSLIFFIVRFTMLPHKALHVVLQVFIFELSDAFPLLNGATLTILSIRWGDDLLSIGFLLFNECCHDFIKFGFHFAYCIILFFTLLVTHIFNRMSSLLLLMLLLLILLLFVHLELLISHLGSLSIIRGRIVLFTTLAKLLI